LANKYIICYTSIPTEENAFFGLKNKKQYFRRKRDV